MNNKMMMLLFVCLGFIASLNSPAWGWNHYHGGGWGYYGPGFYPGWGGPNVIINVPVVPPPPQVPYYIRECETVQICNEYDECWLEKRCD